MTEPLPKLLVISDRHQARLPLVQIMEQIFDAGAKWVMLREKDLTFEHAVGLAMQVKDLASRYDAMLTINGDWRLAEKVGADGYHMQEPALVKIARRDLGETVVFGLSAHDRLELGLAAEASVGYATISPIFLTPSKPGHGPAIGLEKLKRWAHERPSLPMIALGGITAKNAASCLAAGAHGVAVMGAVMHSRTPGAVVADILKAIEQAPRA